MDLKSLVRSLPDVPKKGVIFRDITTLIESPEGFKKSVDLLIECYMNGVEADNFAQKIVGIDARGFIFGGAVAYKMGLGFMPVRKQGKLPAETLSQSYALEYGDDCVEIHAGAIVPGERVLLVDDLMATGGTASAAIQLLEQAGAEVVACCFVIDLPDLGGSQKLKEKGYNVITLMEFEGD